MLGKGESKRDAAAVGDLLVPHRALEPGGQEASSLHPLASNQWTPAVPWEHLQPWVISSLGGRGIPGEGLSCEQPAGNRWNECLGREEGIWGMHYGIHDSPIKMVGPQELCQQPGTIV